MPPLLIAHGRIPAGSSTQNRAREAASDGFQPAELLIADNRLIEIGALQPTQNTPLLDASGCTIVPGFVDVHVHGGGGYDTMDATVVALREIARFKAQHGVTSFLATTVTATPQATAAAVANVAAAPKTVDGGARLLGLHLEGPFISPQFPGAQSLQHIRPPDLDEFGAWIACGRVRMITLAPEVRGAEKLIARALEKEIIAVSGHTNAGFEETMAAFEQGVTQVTHAYNAMTGLHHRRPGTLGATLVHDGVYAQLIADNVHVHPAAMDILYRCKGIEKILLITDAMRAAGLEEGEYTLGDHVVTVRDDRCMLPDGTLAGSVLTMEKALKNFIAATGAGLDEAWPASSRNAATALGLADEIGRIEIGYRADLVLLDADLTVVATLVGGEIAYLRDSARLSGA